MSVYFIASYDIEDLNAYENYAPAADPLLEKHGGELIVADDEAKDIEGKGKQVNVILRFESEETAMNFYNDPDYKSVRQIRLNSTKNGTVILARQYE